MDATYYQKALKSKLLVLAGAAAIALGLCLAPRPVLASELIGGGVEPILVQLYFFRHRDTCF